MSERTQICVSCRTRLKSIGRLGKLQRGRLHAWMGRPPDVEDLQEDDAAGILHRFCYGPPALNLFRSVYPRGVGIPMTVWAHNGGLCDQKAALACPLRVVLCSLWLRDGSCEV